MKTGKVPFGWVPVLNSGIMRGAASISWIEHLEHLQGICTMRITPIVLIATKYGPFLKTVKIIFG